MVTSDPRTSQTLDRDDLVMPIEVRDAILRFAEAIEPDLRGYVIRGRS